MNEATTLRDELVETVESIAIMLDEYTDATSNQETAKQTIPHLIRKSRSLVAKFLDEQPAHVATSASMLLSELDEAESLLGMKSQPAPPLHRMQATQLRDALGLLPTDAPEHTTDETNNVDAILKAIEPRGVHAEILVAMLNDGMTAPEKRRTQAEIIRKAVSSTASDNDYRKYFVDLVKLGAVLKGDTGRGFYLTPDGIAAATAIKKAAGN